MTDTDIPRDPRREASYSIRGYVKQFVRALIILLDSPRETKVYIEAFEDVAKVLGDTITLEQDRERSGTFSITDQTACDMLNLWAKQWEKDKNTRFVYCSTQTPGNSFDHSDAFTRWVSGKHDADTLSSVQTVITSFLTSQSDEKGIKYIDKFASLAAVTGSYATFQNFWSAIEWMLGAPDYNDAFKALEEAIEGAYKLDYDGVRERARSWLGLVAHETSANPGIPRGLTLQYLEENVSNTRYIEFAIKLLEMEQKVGQHILEAGATPTITDSIERLKSYAGDLIDQGRQLQLRQFVETITKQTITTLNDALPKNTEYSQEELARRIDTGASIVTRLVSVLLYLIHLDTANGVSLASIALKILTEDALAQQNKGSNWYKLGFVPAMIAFYSCCTLLVDSQSYADMKALMNVDVYIFDKGKRPLREVLLAREMLPTTLIEHASKIPDTDYGKETTANWIVFRKVQPIISEYIKNEDALNHAFDETEVLLSLLYLDPISEDVDAPRVRTHVDRTAVNVIERLKADEDKVGYNKWGPLQAGFWLDQLQYWDVRNRVRDYWREMGY